MSAFDDYFAKMMPDAGAWFASHAAEPGPGDEPLITKHAMTFEVSEELLMDYGVIPDTRPPLPPPPWRTRLRWRWYSARTHAAEIAYKLISGYDVPEREE